jgi:hypothetical protein
VASLLLGRAVMITQLSSADRLKVLRFAACFVWADLDVAEPERRFLTDLARELDIEPRVAAELLAQPPCADDVDPTDVGIDTANAIRHVALRAIAADGRVIDKEMAMFELLDDLLPKDAVPLRASRRSRSAPVSRGSG